MTLELPNSRIECAAQLPLQPGTDILRKIAPERDRPEIDAQTVDAEVPGGGGVGVQDPFDGADQVGAIQIGEPRLKRQGNALRVGAHAEALLPDGMALAFHHDCDGSRNCRNSRQARSRPSGSFRAASFCCHSTYRRSNSAACRNLRNDVCTTMCAGVLRRMTSRTYSRYPESFASRPGRHTTAVTVR